MTTLYQDSTDFLRTQDLPVFIEHVPNQNTILSFVPE